MEDMDARILGKESVKQVLRMMVPAGCILAWTFIVFLSATLYQGCSVVGVATFSTMVDALSFVITLAIILSIADIKHLAERELAFQIVGGALLAAASGICFALPFSGQYELLVRFVFNFLLGVGLAGIALSFIVLAARMAFVSVVIWLSASMLLGFILFLLYMALVPVAQGLFLLWLLPLFAVCFSLVSARFASVSPKPPDTCAKSLVRSPLRGMFDHRSFVVFAAISGFLFGYCYNIYPKSTRYAGIYTEPLLGSTSSVSVTLIIACCVIIAILIIVCRYAKQRRAYALGSLLLVFLAVLYFGLPSMPTNWMIFVMLDSAAIATMLFTLLRATMNFSFGDREGFVRCLLVLSVGILLGTGLSAFFIESTIPEPVIVILQPLRDVLIVGTPAVFFIALSISLFGSAQNALFPAAMSERPKSVDISELQSTGKTMAKRYGLTPREEEILCMLLLGRSGPYISEDLYLSKSTVKTHIRHIYDKTDVVSRQQLIDLAHSLR